MTIQQTNNMTNNRTLKIHHTHTQIIESQEVEESTITVKRFKPTLSTNLT